MRAEASIQTGQVLIKSWKEPVDFIAQIEVSDPETSFPPWLELIHELMVALRVAHAVLPIWPTYNAVSSDTTFVRIVLDTRWGEYNLGAPGELDRQRSQANHWRYKLGTDYIRHPRWGTYLHRSHLERVGGLDRVRELARPARIVELGDLVFLQCTERVTDALTADAERTRQALQDVLAPIICPPKPTSNA
jgi:hypothetical protein